jgi:hypothetical protein
MNEPSLNPENIQKNKILEEKILACDIIFVFSNTVIDHG